jgi:hypothetical protein
MNTNNQKKYDLLDEMFATANINLPVNFLEKFQDEVESDRNWELLNEAIASLQERRDSRKSMRIAKHPDQISGEVKRYTDRSRYGIAKAKIEKRNWFTVPRDVPKIKQRVGGVLVYNLLPPVPEYLDIDMNDNQHK